MAAPGVSAVSAPVVAAVAAAAVVVSATVVAAAASKPWMWAATSTRGEEVKSRHEGSKNSSAPKPPSPHPGEEEQEEVEEEVGSLTGYAGHTLVFSFKGDVSLSRITSSLLACACASLPFITLS